MPKYQVRKITLGDGRRVWALFILSETYIIATADNFQLAQNTFPSAIKFLWG